MLAKAEMCWQSLSFLGDKSSFQSISLSSVGTLPNDLSKYAMALSIQFFIRLLFLLEGGLLLPYRLISLALIQF